MILEFSLDIKLSFVVLPKSCYFSGGNYFCGLLRYIGNLITNKNGLQ